METIVILDFGSQFTQLIARRVREVGVYCEILPFNAPWSRIAELVPRGMILSGGPASVTADSPPRIPAEALAMGGADSRDLLWSAGPSSAAGRHGGAWQSQ